jgi:hypothetical protein
MKLKTVEVNGKSYAEVDANGLPFMSMTTAKRSASTRRRPWENLFAEW